MYVMFWIYLKRINFNKVDNLKQALLGKKQASSIEDYLNTIKEEKLDCFPTTNSNSLIPLRKSLRPGLSIFNGKGSAADFTETVAMTVSSILRVISETRIGRIKIEQ